MKIHTGERHFACFLCSRRFLAKGSYLRHMNLVHPGGVNPGQKIRHQEFTKGNAGNLRTFTKLRDMKKEAVHSGDDTSAIDDTINTLSVDTMSTLSADTMSTLSADTMSTLSVDTFADSMSTISVDTFGELFSEDDTLTLDSLDMTSLSETEHSLSGTSNFNSNDM